MHIVIDARIINSPTGTYVERLVTYLQKIDKLNDYSVIVPSKDKDFWIPSGSNFVVRTADFDSYSFSEQIGFKKYLEKLQPDLVHFCMPHQPILYRGRSVTTFHDLNLLKTWNSDKNWVIYHFKQLIGRFVFYYVAHKNVHILTPSQFSKKELVAFSHINPDKVTVTYESADVSKDKTTPYDLPFKRYLLYVGQQPDYKNIRRLGDAHQKLLAKYPDLGLVLVGRKKEDTLKNERYFSSKNYQQILFTDFIVDAQRDWLFEHCAAYCFPSLMEGFGLPPLEAMGRGAPVVASRATCIPEILGDAARYFDPLDVNDMVRSIDIVLSDKNIRVTMVKRGYSQLKKYSWLRMAKQTHQAYIDSARKQL